ncbi:unnamed protein product [Dracunculus medinensis]|uniref:SWIM-type domain-containing protein n=1 Tax=Dracunculus medinensis TaxID=318479 RepID=A0A0N4UH21_DRAME|nr:unnamed protein product [Dracunculus medinensis]
MVMDRIDLSIDEKIEALDPNDVWLMRAAAGEQEQINTAEVGQRAASGESRHDDQLSFEDSERFEEDSLCSWQSDSDSICHHFRGWNATSHNPFSENNAEKTSCTELSSNIVPDKLIFNQSIFAVLSLSEYAARKTALTFSYDMIESTYNAIIRSYSSQEIAEKTSYSEASSNIVPDKLFMKILLWCFPENEQDIRLYSCLANGSVDEYNKGEYLFGAGAVRDIFQIGYHLSATVKTIVTPCAVPRRMCEAQNLHLHPARLSRSSQNVSIRIDRCRIVSCQCSCSSKSSWCQHIVAACLYRINFPFKVEYRTTIWDSINELNNAQLKKLSLFLINELPRQYLPIAQRLIDQLRIPSSEITEATGAPDPTDGGHEETAIWSLELHSLTANINRILNKFCAPSPVVHCDVQYLSSNPPPVASEWQWLLQPHRSKEPEGLWNLLSITREMFKRRDENALNILHTITMECLASSSVIWWWYQTSLTQSGEWSIISNKTSASFLCNQKAPQFNCASLCDEVVHLWRLAALNPNLSKTQRIQNIANSQGTFIVDRYREQLSRANARFTYQLFPGFLRALEACYVPWNKVKFSDSVGFRSNENCHNFQKVLSTIFTKVHFNVPSKNSLEGRLQSDSTTSISSHTRTRTSFDDTNVRSNSYDNKDKNRSSKKRIKQMRFSRYNNENDHGNILATDPELSAESGQESDDEFRPIIPSDIETVSHYIFDIHDTDEQSLRPFPFGEVQELFCRAQIRYSEWDLMFAHCEGLMAHGFTHEACKLAVEIANKLMSDPPNLVSPPLFTSSCSECETSTHVTNQLSDPKAKKGLLAEIAMGNPCKKLVDQALKTSQLAASTFSRFIVKFRNVFFFKITYSICRILFLVEALMKEQHTRLLAFQLALKALEIPRSPAATNFLEVKLYYYESELTALLRRMEIGSNELKILREHAQNFLETIDSFIASAEPHALPICLAHYLFDQLSNTQSCDKNKRKFTISRQGNISRQKCDEMLGFCVAVGALDLKLMVSETNYPMLSESTRRQQGQLAFIMLIK